MLDAQCGRVGSELCEVKGKRIRSSQIKDSNPLNIGGLDWNSCLEHPVSWAGDGRRKQSKVKE